MLKAVLNLKDYMLKTPYERILDEATSDDNNIVPTNTLAQIAQGSEFYEGYQLCKSHLWTLIKDRNISSKRLLKTLNLLEYLLIHANEDLVYEFREEIFYVNLLKDFKYMENGCDLGGPAREKAVKIIEMLENPEKLNKDREEQKILKDRVSGISSDGKDVKILKNINNTEKIQKQTQNNNIVKEEPKKITQDFNDFGSFGQPVSKTDNNWSNWGSFNNWETNKNNSDGFGLKIEDVKKNEKPQIQPISNNPSNIKSSNISVVPDLLDLDIIPQITENNNIINQNIPIVNEQKGSSNQNINKNWNENPFDKPNNNTNDIWSNTQNQNWNWNENKKPDNSLNNFDFNSSNVFNNQKPQNPPINQQQESIYKKFTPLESNLINLNEIANDDKAWNWRRQQEALKNQNLLHANQKDLDNFFN